MKSSENHNQQKNQSPIFNNEIKNDIFNLIEMILKFQEKSQHPKKRIDHDVFFISVEEIHD